MNNGSPRNNEGEEEVECEESGEGSVVYREAPSDSLNKSTPDVGDSRKEVGNNSGPPE